MKILTQIDIINAFDKTIVKLNGVTLQNAFHVDGALSKNEDGSNGFHTTPINVIHEVMTYLDNPWCVLNVHCDGGVNHFEIGYQFYGHCMTVYAMTWQTPTPVTSAKEFAEFLNMLEQKLFTAVKHLHMDIIE